MRHRTHSFQPKVKGPSAISPSVSASRICGLAMSFEPESGQLIQGDLREGTIMGTAMTTDQPGAAGHRATARRVKMLTHVINSLDGFVPEPKDAANLSCRPSASSR